MTSEAALRYMRWVRRIARNDYGNYLSAQKAVAVVEDFTLSPEHLAGKPGVYEVSKVGGAYLIRYVPVSEWQKPITRSWLVKVKSLFVGLLDWLFSTDAEVTRLAKRWSEHGNH